MSPVRLIILLVAAGAAVAAVFLVRSVQTPAPAVAVVQPEEAKPADVPAKQVLVTKSAIPVGKFVAADDLAWQSWPADAQMDSFIEQGKDPEALEKMVGAVARFDMVAGEPVTNSKLAHPGSAGFMSVMLTPGMRAVSVEIAAEIAAGGFIQPNDRVDVIVTRQIDSNGNGNSGGGLGIRSDQILSNIRVLAIDAQYGLPPTDDEGEPQSGQGEVIIGSRATLELTERDATLLNTAKKAGDIALTLRSIADMNAPQGATPAGRVYRDGVSQDAEGVRVYRYGNETVASSPAG
jgi:pilus assembly protein CpaB